MKSLNKDEIQASYNKLLGDVLSKNESINKSNEIEKTRIEAKYQNDLEKSKKDYEDSICHLKVENDKIEIQNTQLTKEHDEKEIFINAYNKRIDELNGYPIRVFNSSKMKLNFRDKRIYVYDEIEFKDMAHIIINNETDLENFKLYLKGELVLAKLVETNENVFLIKEDFGWSDKNDNYYTSLEVEVTDGLICKGLNKKILDKLVLIDKKPIPKFKYPNRDVYNPKKLLDLPQMETEVFVGIPFKFERTLKMKEFNHGNF